MMLKGKKSSFALTVIASSLLIGCNDSGSDPKLASVPEKAVTKSEITGVALDGYLVNATVCIDVNRNNTCESDDGAIAYTDDKGAFTLPTDGIDLTKYSVLVEAIARQTKDKDSQEIYLQDSFVLSAPADSASAVTPLTTLISAVANQQSIDYQSATALVAKHLNVENHRLTSDYLANDHVKNTELHAFAQGLTVLMQEGEKQSVVNGVSGLDARKGIQAKLAMLDLTSLKAETDQLVGTVNHTPEKIREVVKALSEEVTFSRDDMNGSQISVTPPAPINDIVNDDTDTFDWDWVGLFTATHHYEYSTDAGNSWKQITAKPLVVGSEEYPVGDIQVRVRAELANNIKAGKVLKNSQPFTGSKMPAAPASVTVNDVDNEFDWELVQGYDHASDYEYSTDGGSQWQQVRSKPQEVEDVAIAAGALQIRVAADDSGAELQLAGRSAVSLSAFTLTPAQPFRPVLTAVSDETDSVDWKFVEGFSQVNHYEVSFDSGKSWTKVEKKPLSVGNRALPVESVQIRVAADKGNGMPAGMPATVQQSFTVQTAKPALPGNLRVNDADNTVDWDWVEGFAESGFYEISLHGISVEDGQWHDVGGKPAAVPDENFAKGDVCIRVKADVLSGNVSGMAACTDAYFTAKPDMPTAPVIDDENDTFGWILVEGYPQLSDYQIKIGEADWLQVSQGGGNPYQLEDKGYPINSIQVRVGADVVTGRVAGDALTNDVAFTRKAPTSAITLLTSDGSVTHNRDEAACARLPNDKVWQLFHHADADKRFKLGTEIYSELDSFSACGIHSWRMPTTAELNSLFTVNSQDSELKIFDQNVFAHMEVAGKSFDNHKSCYLSSDASSATTGNKECLDISDIELPRVTDVQDECRMFCFSQPKPLYRFIAE